MPETRIARLLADLVARLPSVVPTIGLYAAGSLGTRDFEPDRSDLDLVAVIGRAPGKEELQALAAVHRDLEREHPAGARLHCLYVVSSEIEDRAREWPNWADGRMGRKRLTAIVRTELHDHGVVVAGPPIAGQIPYVTPEELIEGIRTDLTTVWLPAADKRRPWLSDSWVDLGLTMLPRARAAINEGVLLTKTQAIAELADFDVPDWVRDDMLARRRGWVAPLTGRDRARRARIAQDAVRRGVERLLAELPNDLP